jgi:hypothetical protein
MRTTINLDDELLREAKGVAAATGKSLTEVVEDSLREALSRRKTVIRGKRIELPTFKGNGLQSGVDLNDSASLLDLMDRTDAAN